MSDEVKLPGRNSSWEELLAFCDTYGTEAVFHFLDAAREIKDRTNKVNLLYHLLALRLVEDAGGDSNWWAAGIQLGYTSNRRNGTISNFKRVLTRAREFEQLGLFPHSLDETL